jgi:hypothetical protein
MKNLLAWFKDNLWYIISYLAFMTCFFVAMAYIAKQYQPQELKDYKDGVQNHLVWSIKGECFFVRPHAETTVYLIRVADCDRK